MFAESRHHTDYNWNFFQKLQHLLERAFQWPNTTWAYQKSYRKSVYELSKCTDRELRDLGIFRNDIGRIAREAAQQATETTRK